MSKPIEVTSAEAFLLDEENSDLLETLVDYVRDFEAGTLPENEYDATLPIQYVIGQLNNRGFEGIVGNVIGPGGDVLFRHALTNDDVDSSVFPDIRLDVLNDLHEAGADAKFEYKEPQHDRQATSVLGLTPGVG